MEKLKTKEEEDEYTQARSVVTAANVFVKPEDPARRQKIVEE